jgi:hypothetical protein
MISTSDIILKYVCPGLGVIMGNLMFAAPLRDCYNAVKAGKGLGTLNPIPWAFCAGNCFGVCGLFGSFESNFFPLTLPETHVVKPTTYFDAPSLTFFDVVFLCLVAHVRDIEARFIHIFCKCSGFTNVHLVESAGCEVTI